jgi:hypothetical protein
VVVALSVVVVLLLLLLLLSIQFTRLGSWVDCIGELVLLLMRVVEVAWWGEQAR